MHETQRRLWCVCQLPYKELCTFLQFQFEGLQPTSMRIMLIFSSLRCYTSRWNPWNCKCCVRTYPCANSDTTLHMVKVEQLCHALSCSCCASGTRFQRFSGIANTRIREFFLSIHTHSVVDDVTYILLLFNIYSEWQ